MMVLPLRVVLRSFQCGNTLRAIRVNSLGGGKPFGTSKLGKKDAGMDAEKKCSTEANFGRSDRS